MKTDEAEVERLRAELAALRAELDNCRACCNQLQTRLEALGKTPKGKR